MQVLAKHLLSFIMAIIPVISFRIKSTLAPNLIPLPNQQKSCGNEFLFAGKTYSITEIVKGSSQKTLGTMDLCTWEETLAQ